MDLERDIETEVTVANAWLEYRQLAEAIAERTAADPDYVIPADVDQRVAELEHSLDSIPAVGWRDVHARANWLQATLSRDVSREGFADRDAARRLRLDIEALHASLKGGVTAQRRTASERRQAVMSILDADPLLSDREIARRAGVVPQTVGNLRRQRQEKQR